MYTCFWFSKVIECTSGNIVQYFAKHAVLPSIFLPTATHILKLCPQFWIYFYLQYKISYKDYQYFVHWTSWMPAKDCRLLYQRKKFSKLLGWEYFKYCSPCWYAGKTLHWFCYIFAFCKPICKDGFFKILGLSLVFLFNTSFSMCCLWKCFVY